MRQAELLARLGFLVLRRADDDTFVRVGDAPLWFLRLFPDAEVSAPLHVEEAFPFLESFLPTARNYWGSRGRGRIRSGQWISHYPSGEELPLEASAISHEEQDYLLIEFNKSVYERDKGYLQKARENALDSERAALLERALRAERTRLGALMECFNAPVLRVDGKGRVVATSPPRPRESLPADLGEIVPGAAGEALMESILEVLRSGAPSATAAGWRLMPISREECWAVGPETGA